MPTQIKNIFSDTACPTQETMFKYLDNLLKGEEKHAFERHLAGCSLCEEALEGLSMMRKSDAENDIALIHSRIDNQYLKTEAGYWAWGIAASVSMLLIAGSWAYLHKENAENVAVETKTVMPEKLLSDTIIELKPGTATTSNTSIAESVIDSIVVEPIDKSIALSNDMLEEKNIISDAGKVEAPKPSPAVMKRSDQGPVEITAPQLSNNEKSRKPITHTNTNTGGAGYSNDFAKEKVDADQKIGAQDDEQTISTSPGISSQMLAFEESIISGNVEGKKDNIAPSSVTNKTANAPSAVPSARTAESVTQPYLKQEEKRKSKSMEGCKNCPDKKISQSAAQDMQELTYDYAVKKFNEKSYAEAHLKFDQFIKENPESYEAGNSRIYDAICLVYQNKPEEALARLNELNGHKEFSDDAKWLKAAIYIDQDKPNEAIVLLKELEKNKNYKEKAAKAIQDLR
jgi:TolA-binding protein